VFNISQLGKENIDASKQISWSFWLFYFFFSWDSLLKCIPATCPVKIRSYFSTEDCLKLRTLKMHDTCTLVICSVVNYHLKFINVNKFCPNLFCISGKRTANEGCNRNILFLHF
jgi:hypothetical protein